MLNRTNFDPFNEASPDDFVKAHILLSNARGTRVMQDTGAIAQDFAQYIGYSRGNSIRDLGFRLYKNDSGDTIGLTRLRHHKPGSILLLDALAVDEAHRDQHYGGEILDDTIQTAIALGLAQVSLTVFTEREKARRLYTSRRFLTVGYSSGAEHMMLDVA